MCPLYFNIHFIVLYITFLLNIKKLGMIYSDSIYDESCKQRVGVIDSIKKSGYVNMMR